jgi:hypothetical protein
MAWTEEQKKAYKAQQERDARVGYLVIRLSSMGRGAGEVLAHLFIGPKTIAELRSAMVLDRTKKRDDFEREYVPRVEPEPWERGITSTVEFDVDYTMLYDLGQLATAGIVTSDNNGVLRVVEHYREEVSIFLRTAFVHVHKNCHDFRNAVSKALHGETRHG